MLRSALALLLLFAACSTPPESGEPAKSAPRDRKEQEKDLLVDSRPESFTDERPVPKPNKEEVADFERVWEYYRSGDPRWPLERDRYKLRSEAAAYVLAAHLMRHYMHVNQLRDRAGKELVRVKAEIIEAGEPCVPALVDLMILDAIPMRSGERFLVDDVTRQDCGEMLERIGPPSVPHLMRALERPDLGAKGRRLIALALGGTKDRRCYDALVKLLRSDPSWQVRADAASALGRLGDRRALAPLATATQHDDDPAVQRRARKAHGELLSSGAR